MAKVGAVRRRIGKPTVFNLVGPLCNPANVTVQVIGVVAPDQSLQWPEASAACWPEKSGNRFFRRWC